MKAEKFLTGWVFVLYILCSHHKCMALSRDEALKQIYDLLDEETIYKLSETLAGSMADEGYLCEDDPKNGLYCEDWKKAGACENNKVWMGKYCRKTCNDCRPPSPSIPAIPECAKTQYGCCWDNITKAEGPTTDLAQSKCPPCLNKQSNLFCKNWKSDCDSKVRVQRVFMRTHCATTCGVPCDQNWNINNCRDINVKDCIAWYKDGKCETDKEKMRVFCPAMCGLCRR